MSINYDLIGQTFGSLKVVERVYINGKPKWKCKCECGNDNYTVVTSSLISGKTTKCDICGRKALANARRKNRIGEKVGHLTIVDQIYNYNNTHRTFYVCNCDCGTKGIIRQIGHNEGQYASCGCQRKSVVVSWRGKDINGQKFGKLTVLKTLWEENPPKVLCRCDCGNEKILIKNDVQSYHTLSCGCLQKERAGSVNFVDQNGYVSDSGIKIIKPVWKNEKNQWLWECKCGYCGNIFIELPARIKNNHVQSCGCINHSVREKYIEKILINNNYIYSTQYTFPDCKDKYVLRFDFAIFNKNNELLCLIEYDGEQHYKPVEFFGGEEGFKNAQNRDKIKNDYCENNNINLIRLPYFLSNDEIKDIIINIKKA